MPKIKSLVVSALLALAAAVLVPGCSLFSSDGASTSERLATVKTVAKTVLKVVCTAYSSGGDTLAEAKIDELAADGKLTESQATALKSMLASGVSTLKKIADSEDSVATATDLSGTAATETK
jgi:2-polyprenyl-3-methyl-5-hydroxy-6-metoxy-1,4-benzoquinol methylase